jgi:DNA-binding CsgD family transcriptional regulator/tetratricopeptide (TPR) repeat protein
MSELRHSALLFKSPLLRTGRSPLVGRARQLTALADHLAAMRSGQSIGATVIMLAGAPGIGKSRLLEEFPPRELAEGVTALRGGASQAEGMPPYLPFLEAIGEYIVAAPADRLREQIGVHSASLAALFPEIPARLGPPPPQYPLGAEQERFRLYEAVVAFLTAIAANGPLVLLFDDLQWSDAATLDLLVHVAYRVRSAALLIVGAYREGEADDNTAFVRALAELNRRRLLVTLPLSPLEIEESRALAMHLLRGEIAPEVDNLLHRQSEGNPFFLEELLRALVEAETLVWQDGRWRLASDPGRFVPPQVVEAIHMRLARLEPAQVDLLRVAAVIGRTFEPALLAQVMRMDVEQTEAMLLAAARARLLRPEADGAFAFAHDMVRETLYAEVGSTRRKRLHQAIGEALEAQADADSQAFAARRLADLAFHFAEAGVKGRGVTYALASAQRAMHASAAVEAIAHYWTALHLLGPEGDIAQRAAAWLGLGDAATIAGDYRQAAEAYEATQRLWLRIGDVASAARAWRGLGRVRWRQEAVAEAREAFAQALELLGPEDSADAAETLLQLADLYATSLGRNAEGLAYAEQALAMVERLGDRRLEATACCVVGNVRARSNDLASGRVLLERALALAQALDDPALGAEACAYLANVYAWVADLDRSREVSVLRAELAWRTHDLFHLRHVYSWIGLQDTCQGRWAEAEQWYAQQEPLVVGLQSPEPRAALQLGRAILRFYQGRFAEAEQELRDVVEMLRPTGSGTLVWYLGWFGQILVELGRQEEALACFADLYALADSLDERARARGNAFAVLVVGYARLGEQERAAGCYPKLLPFQGQFSPVLIDRALGVAAFAGGDSAAARRHLMDAEAEARRAGVRPELALTLLQRGLLEQVLVTEGMSQLPTSSGALAEGLRLCEELGMQELGRRVLNSAMSQPERRRRSARRPVGAAGLSERELEVLRLVAQGKTNREIAEALILSEKTVARHLTNIFNKISVENRAGAAAFALRHGLA